MVMPALKRGGYEANNQVHIGQRLGGKGKHMIDAIAVKDGKTFLVSSKWQQTPGTAEQKVPFEVICLAKAVNDEPEKYQKAYLVLGGDGWTLRDFFTSGDLKNYLKDVEKVEVLTLEKFVGMANK
jgi:hypothetical protein